MGTLYIAYNGAMPTTAAMPKVATGTAIKTMLQLAPLTTAPIVKLKRWGVSFDGSAAATPIQCELIETDVAATVTAHVASGIMPYDNPNAVAASNFFTLTTTGTGYSASIEGTPAASRLADYQNIAPTNQFIYDWVLGGEFGVTPGRFVRVRVTAGTSVGMTTYILFEI
jgi:hypothetical protein